MIRELLKDKNVFATPIVLFLISDLGNDALVFEPETIADRLREIEPGVSASVIERVNAALGLYTSNLFWEDPVIFGVVCRALNRATFPTADEPSIGDIAWGVTEAGLLTKDVIDEDPTDSFSTAIIKYVKYTLKINGMYTAPTALEDGFGDVSNTLTIDDPGITEARQTEADSAAAAVDAMVASKMRELLLQIKRAGIKLSETAERDLNILLQEVVQ